MSEVDETGRDVQAAKDVLIAANKKHDDAVRRANVGKHVRDMTPEEIRAESRRRGLRQ